MSEPIDNKKYKLKCAGCKGKFISVGPRKGLCSLCQAYKYGQLACRECGEAVLTDYCDDECKMFYLKRLVNHDKLEKMLKKDKEIFLDLKILSLEKVHKLIKMGVDPFEAEKRVFG